MKPFSCQQISLMKLQVISFEKITVNVLLIWIKQLLNLLAVKFHYPRFFVFRDVGDNIRPCRNFTCVRHQLTYKLGD